MNAVLSKPLSFIKPLPAVCFLPGKDVAQSQPPNDSKPSLFQPLNMKRQLLSGLFFHSSGMTNSQPPLTSTENQAIVKPTPVPNPLPTPTPVSVSDSVDAEAVYWNEIEKRNTKSGFELYLAEYPNGRFAKTAKDRIAEESRKKEEIKSAREQAKWDEVSTLNGKSAYQAYLADYPNGKYSYIAKAKIKESENEEARILLKTVAGYRGYLSIYANGEFASLARLRLSDLGEVVTVSISAGTVTTNSLGMKVI